MDSNLAGFLTLLALSCGIALVLYFMLFKSLERLIDQIVNIPSGTIFYLRVFQIGLVLIFLSAALGPVWNFKPDAPFMEYVWKLANGISSALGSAVLFLSVYLILVTVLVAVLSRHDQ